MASDINVKKPKQVFERVLDKFFESTFTYFSFFISKFTGIPKKVLI